MLNRSPGLCHEKALARGGRGAEPEVLKEIRISNTRMVKSLPRAELYDIDAISIQALGLFPML